MKNQKKKNSKKTAAIIIILIIAVILSPYILEFAEIKTSKNDDIVSVSIPSGSSTGDIAETLKENHLIKSKLIFLFKVKTGKYNNKLNYGDFNFRKNMTVSEIIKTIGENAYVPATITVTFPEGASVEQMASSLEDKGLAKSEDFLNALNDSYNYDFIKNIPSANYKYALQGFLFPSTYEFYANASAHDIINKMLGEFDKQYKAVSPNYDNVFKIITKASIIEKEAKLDSERPIIAGVINNRLNANMLLQIDACVVYAVTDGKYNISKVSGSNLKTESLYNTYKYKGLPPGPICNPGIESIKAALNPDANDYLFYHTDETKKDGSHIFTKTFDKHLETME